MTSPTSLIERIEAATEGSRELDLAVHLALFSDDDIASITKYPRGCDHREGYSWDIYKFAIIFEKWTADGRCTYNGGYPLPCYSTSIDAALTLLPDGLDYRLEKCRDIRLGFGAAVFEPGDPSIYPGVTIYSAATSPLALLAAILRARQAAQSGQAQTEARG